MNNDKSHIYLTVRGRTDFNVNLQATVSFVLSQFHNVERIRKFRIKMQKNGRRIFPTLPTRSASTLVDQQHLLTILLLFCFQRRGDLHPHPPPSPAGPPPIVFNLSKLASPLGFCLHLAAGQQPPRSTASNHIHVAVLC